MKWLTTSKAHSISYCPSDRKDSRFGNKNVFLLQKKRRSNKIMKKRKKRSEGKEIRKR